jgi:hypothetical protein
MTRPLHPAHADKVEPIAGADPRLTVRRHLVSYAYPANGNTHNPTPRYDWHLLADGRLVARDAKRGALVAEAREHGADYLAEVSA